MANVPEHIHAFPRLNTEVTLPEAVAAWDENNKILYIGLGDDSNPNGLPFISNCLPQEISEFIKDDNGVFIKVS